MREIKITAIWIWFSLAIAVLVAITSVLGIFNPVTYSQETANWALQGRGQDIGNLIALPIFLISTYFINNGSKKSYFVWMGTLMYFIYAFIIYCFAIHFNSLFLVYVAILGLSLYTFIGGIISCDISSLSKTISVNTWTRFSALFLIIIGILFSLLWLSSVIPAVIAGSMPKDLVETGLWVNPVHVIDLSFVLPGMIITGILFLKKSKYGFLLIFPWLMFSVLMGSSIGATMIMTINQGTEATLVPLIFMGIIVFGSLTTLFMSLGTIEK